MYATTHPDAVLNRNYERRGFDENRHGILLLALPGRAGKAGENAITGKLQSLYLPVSAEAFGNSRK